ncbi:MAG TPA: reverse transcriptase-like protein [Candidatus Acidoferrales bacterium]|nr:reverse transcriptase-like protein [Candidatus Acidoferrales bacterium]
MTPPSKTPPPSSARLFSDSRDPTPPAGVHTANIDGASRGNPGPASYAVILRDPSGKIILAFAKKLGRDTNNVAEYYALLAALDYASSHGISSLRIRSDSELLVRQMQGRYKVKSPDLKPLHERASKLVRQLSYCVFEHVPREMNHEADALANRALDEASPVMNKPKSASHPVGSSSSHSRPSGSTTRRIRSRFIKGAFIPADPIDLPEGTEVFLDILLYPPK